MRRWFLEKFELENYAVTEKSVSINDLLDADELFLTNSLYLLKWVRKIRNKTYTNLKIKEIFKEVIQDI
jgi:branched-chain amino acid aminotransferase